MPVRSEVIDRFFHRASHARAVADVAGSLLARGDAEGAWAFAERRARIMPPVAAEDLLLRAAARRLVGDAGGCDADIEHAKGLHSLGEPFRSLLLADHDAATRLGTARLVLDDPRASTDLQRRAADVLVAAGESIVVGPLGYGAQLFGWCGFQGNSLVLELTAGGRTHRLELAADPRHAMREVLGGAASFRLPFPDVGPAFLTFRTPSASITRALRLPCEKPPRTAPAQSTAASRRMTVIVPVYGDGDATRACLESVHAQRCDGVRIETLVVEDASPDADLVADLVARAEAGLIRLLRNPANMGFVGAMNHAFANAPAGDVLWVNADAVLPPGALERLRSAAQADPKTGIVVPLSNNGEGTSFPIPHEAAPMDAVEDLLAIDAAAAAAHGASTVEIPSGTGFCFYVTAWCREAVGALSEAYERGYGEDGDYCLRAREAGFNVVCAPGVYVGHTGGRSFGASKRALVLRNRRVLEARFPDVRAEAVATAALDPLRNARAAIERRLTPREPLDLLVMPAGTLIPWMRAPGRSSADGLVLAWRGEDARVRLHRPSGTLPQNLAFDLADDKQAGDAASYLATLDLRRVIVADPSSLPETLARLLRPLRAPKTAFYVHAPVGYVAPAGHRCDKPESDAPCIGCAVLPVRARRPSGATLSFDEVGGADARAEAFARSLHGRPGHTLEAPWTAPTLHRRSGTGLPKLGIVFAEPSVAIDRLLAALGRAFSRDGASGAVVLGACVDDLAIMATGSIFVTGLADSAELPDLMRRHGIEALFCPDRRSAWIVERLRGDERLPAAWFDWSHVNASRRTRARHPDLSLDGRVCDAKAVRLLLDWLAHLDQPGASDE